jgi:hypothetical protein
MNTKTLTLFLIKRTHLKNRLLVCLIVSPLLAIAKRDEHSDYCQQLYSSFSSFTNASNLNSYVRIFLFLIVELLVHKWAILVVHETYPIVVYHVASRPVDVEILSHVVTNDCDNMNNVYVVSSNMNNDI